MSVVPLKTFVFGSCVARDLVASLGTSVSTVVGYTARQSLLSSYSKDHGPKAELRLPKELPSAFRTRMLTGDLRGSLREDLERRASETDLVLIDLTDERLGVYQLSANCYVTRSIELIDSGLDVEVQALGTHLPFGTDEHFEVWSRAARRFAEDLRRLDLLSRSILVSPGWAERDDKGRTTPTSFGLTAHEASSLLTRYSEVLGAQMPSVSASGRTPVAASDHRWGEAPFHYSEDFYRSLGSEVMQHVRSFDTRATSADRDESVRGSIDNVSSDRTRLSGWIEVHDETRHPAITIHCGSEASGTLTYGSPRADVTSAGIENRQFIATLSEPAPLTALLSGELWLDAPSPSGSRDRISLSSTARRSENLLLHAWLKTFVDPPTETTETQSPAQTTPRTTDDLSSVSFPVGTRSTDGSAILGRAGHLFLTGGSNDVGQIYTVPATDAARRLLEQRASAWVGHVNTRSGKMRSRHISYRHLIVPEKNSSLHELLPGGMPLSPLLEQIERRLDGDESYVSLVHMLSSAEAPEHLWLRHDTHFSASGARRATRHVLQGLADIPAALDDQTFSRPALYQGDLSRRFLDRELWDRQDLPPDTLLKEHAESARLVSAVDPQPARHVGSTRHWTNAAATIDKKVLVFGNSFFGLAGDTAARMSWWFKCLFRDFHFVWSPDVDIELVDALQPDIVISQTVERFLTTIPST